MQFSYSAIWDEAARLLKAHASLLVAIAGAFLFLPQLLLAYALPMPTSTDSAEVVPLFAAYLEGNWPWILAVFTIGAVGSIAMLLLVFDRSGTMSVGDSIRSALPLLATWLIASFLSNLMIVAGWFLFLLPGFYLLGRLAVATPAIVAEGVRNPIEAIRRSFLLTRGRGWAVAGLVVLIVLTGYIVTIASSNVIGAVFVIVAGQALGGILSLILESALGATLSTVLLVLFAAIYNRLAAA